MSRPKVRLPDGTIIPISPEYSPNAEGVYEMLHEEHRLRRNNVTVLLNGTPLENGMAVPANCILTVIQVAPASVLMSLEKAAQSRQPVQSCTLKQFADFHQEPSHAPSTAVQLLQEIGNNGGLPHYVEPWFKRLEKPKPEKKRGRRILCACISF